MRTDKCVLTCMYLADDWVAPRALRAVAVPGRTLGSPFSRLGSLRWSVRCPWELQRAGLHGDADGMRGSSCQWRLRLSQHHLLN
jgi:hypothetical protein